MTGAEPEARWRIGVDVGGTFTDFTLLDQTSGTLHFCKCPSTPDDPAAAIEAGLVELQRAVGFAPNDVGYLGHGTTVATNIVVERRGARTGLLTTLGFRDVLELGRQARPSIYDYRVAKPPPLVPRDRRLEVEERVGPEGEILVPLDDSSLEAAVAALAVSGVESVAICFLHAYRTSDHEVVAEAAVRRLLPGAFVSVSSTVLPEFREYERLSTTVVNAFVGPRMGRYLEGFARRIRALGITVEPYTIHSNGGLMPVAMAQALPVRTCVSGPAAGVVGAAEIGRAAGFLDLVTFDVGGTSTDVSLVHAGRPGFTASRSVAGYPVKTPMLDIHVIGAGGGSIARVDDAGALEVGPRSAGAEPGPVAYGRGGAEPTLTDANLVLGRLAPTTALAGRLALDLAAARRAIDERIARPLGLDTEAAALGIVRIANATMSRAIRSVSIERGHDVARFALAAYGGAGPLHAAEVALECGIPRVLVPLAPGTLCARGMLLTDLSADYVRSHLTAADAEGWGDTLALFAEMTREGDAWLDDEGIPAARRRFEGVLEARYRGQNFEVRVDCEGLGPDDLEAFGERFAAAHARDYGYAIPGRAVELVSARLRAVGEVGKAPQAQVAGGTSLRAAVVGRRPLYLDAETGWTEVEVYARERLPVGVALTGPAVIEEMSATTLVLARQPAEVDALGNLVLGTPG